MDERRRVIVLHTTPFADRWSEFIGHATLIDVGGFRFLRQPQAAANPSDRPATSRAFGAPELAGIAPSCTAEDLKTRAAASALWAFGSTVYFICTGELPHPKRTACDS